MSGVPNLDAMSGVELMAFWKRYHRATRKDARGLLGHGKHGYLGIVATLAAYACAKASAISCRIAGDIRGAMVYEGHCDIYYAKLPEGAKW